MEITLDMPCKNCGNLAILSEEWVKAGGEPFDDNKRVGNRIRYLYKCTKCRTTTPGQWIPIGRR